MSSTVQLAAENPGLPHVPHYIWQSKYFPRTIGNGTIGGGWGKTDHDYYYMTFTAPVDGYFVAELHLISQHFIKMRQAYTIGLIGLNYQYNVGSNASYDPDLDSQQHEITAPMMVYKGQKIHFENRSVFVDRQLEAIGLDWNYLYDHNPNQSPLDKDDPYILKCDAYILGLK